MASLGKADSNPEELAKRKRIGKVRKRRIREDPGIVLRGRKKWERSIFRIRMLWALIQSECDLGGADSKLG